MKAFFKNKRRRHYHGNDGDIGEQNSGKKSSISASSSSSSSSSGKWSNSSPSVPGQPCGTPQRPAPLGSRRTCRCAFLVLKGVFVHEYPCAVVAQVCVCLYVTHAQMIASSRWRQEAASMHPGT